MLYAKIGVCTRLHHRDLIHINISICEKTIIFQNGQYGGMKFKSRKRR